MSHLRIVLGAALTALPLSGCYVYSEPPAYETVAYAPPYYAGNAVYYDQVGTPYIYVDGTMSYVPPSYAHYDVLVTNYREHAAAYRSWEQRQGERRASERRERERREPPRRDRD